MYILNPGPVVCESSTLSARPQRLPLEIDISMPSCAYVELMN